MTPIPNTLLHVSYCAPRLGALLLLRWFHGLHLFTYSTFVVDNDLDHQRDFNDGYKVFSLTLPNELTFCGEKVPLERLGCARTPGPGTAW